MAAKSQGTWRTYEPAGMPADLTVVDTTQQFDLGFRIKAKDMGTTAYGRGEFIYLKGTNSSSVVAGSVVLIKDDYSTSKVAARDIGKLALALSAVDSGSKYGWFQIVGQGVAACDTVAANAACYIDGTAGRIDDLAVAGDGIIGMRTVTADDTNTCVVNVLHPGVGDFDNA